MVLEIILIVIGFVFLIKGADLLLKASISIAKKLGLSDILIGLTIVAIGTSFPEIFITIASSINGHSELIIGNAIGSCICNFLLVMGITCIVKPVKLDKRIISTHLPIGIGAMLLLLLFGNIGRTNHIITSWQGVLLLLYTLLYTIYTLYEEKKLKNKDIDEELIEDVETKGKFSITMSVIYFVLRNSRSKIWCGFCCRQLSIDCWTIRANREIHWNDCGCNRNCTTRNNNRNYIS